jgi:hypothetical protein
MGVARYLALSSSAKFVGGGENDDGINLSAFYFLSDGWYVYKIWEFNDLREVLYQN